MEFLNGYFEGLDGFQNTKAGADRLRAIEPRGIGESLDNLFASIIDRAESFDRVKTDIEYSIDQLQRLLENVRKDQPATVLESNHWSIFSARGDKIGWIRRYGSGGFCWFGLGRSGRVTQSFESAAAGAKRAFGAVKIYDYLGRQVYF